jgi:hypothetical protein
MFCVVCAPGWRSVPLASCHFGVHSLEHEQASVVFCGAGEVQVLLVALESGALGLAALGLGNASCHCLVLAIVVKWCGFHCVTACD